MSQVQTVEDDSDVVVTATSEMQHHCPHVDELDHGRITITWRVQGKTFELHSLAKFLKGFKDTTASHEQLTDHIRYVLSIVPGVELIHVASEWTTAGMEVTCSTSPTRAENRS